MRQWGYSCYCCFHAAQLGVLVKHDSGQLRRDMNDAVTQFGHGRLVRATGETQDIGGSTGGGSRRVIDDWVAPDWRQFLADSLDFEHID